MLMVGEQERRDRFGYALQEALRRRGMSERELARRLEIDSRQIAKWRAGKGLPDLYQTQAIASTLRVIEELFRNPPPVPVPPAYPIERYLLESTEQMAERAADAAVDEALDEQSPGAAPDPVTLPKPGRGSRRGR